MNSEVSTSGVCSEEVSSLSHVWFCDVASLVPSWHCLRRGGMTFPKTRQRLALLIYCDAIYMFSFASWSILDSVLLLCISKLRLVIFQ